MRSRYTVGLAIGADTVPLTRRSTCWRWLTLSENTTRSTTLSRRPLVPKKRSPRLARQGQILSRPRPSMATI